MVELQVEGMSCNHCISRVTKSVHGIDSNAEVTIDLATKTVRVNATADAEDISAAIVDAGYAVTSSKSV